MILFNVHGILMTQDYPPLPRIIKHQIQSKQGRDSMWPGACSAYLQSCVALPLEALALGTEPFGKKMLYLLVSACPQSCLHCSEHGSRETGPWAVCFYSYQVS